MGLGVSRRLWSLGDLGVPLLPGVSVFRMSGTQHEPFYNSIWACRMISQQFEHGWAGFKSGLIIRSRSHGSIQFMFRTCQDYHWVELSFGIIHLSSHIQLMVRYYGQVVGVCRFDFLFHSVLSGSSALI